MNQQRNDSKELKKLKKEEKKRKKEGEKILKQNQLTRDYLIREEKRNQLCLERSKNEIENWIESFAVEDLQSDILILSQRLNRLIDKSQHAIEVIENHRIHAEEQYDRNFQNHCKILDYIKGSHSHVAQDHIQRF